MNLFFKEILLNTTNLLAYLKYYTRINMSVHPESQISLSYILYDELILLYYNKSRCQR
jgi:hypothetical protein